MNERRNKTKKSKKSITGKHLPGSSISFNAKQVGVIKLDNISMSQQLNLRKIAKAKVKKTPKKIKTNKRNSNRGRRSMPSFADLEKMFDDSEATGTVDKAKYNDINSNPIQTESKNDITGTLTQNILHSVSNNHNVISVDNQIPLINTVTTPNSLNCNNNVEILSPDLFIAPKPRDSEEIIVIDDEEPEEDILTQERKRKKSISQTGDIIEHDHPKKIRRLSESKTSHAIKNDPDDSDSDVTIIYDLEGPPKKSPLHKRFSPLPSTSTDSITISENEKSFIDSLSVSEDSTSMEISREEYQDVIVIDDIDSTYSAQEAQNLENVREERLEEQPLQESYSGDIDDLVETNYSSNDLVDVDAIIAENECILTKYKTVENLPTIIEVEPRQNITQINTVLPVDLHISTSNNQVTRSVPTDVDAIIAENECILTKYNTVENLPTIIEVEPRQNITQINTVLPVDLHLSTSNNQGTRSVPTQIATNENNSTQSHNSNIRDINHRNSQRTGRSTSAPINTVNQHTPRSYIVIQPQNTRPVNQITNYESTSLNCPICLENLRSRECASTICGHIFCMQCIKRALKDTKRCPTCRKTVKSQGYHRLFL